MTYDEIQYLRGREMQERAAAKKASNVAVRRVHQQMAEGYAALLAGIILREPLTSLRTYGGRAYSRSASQPSTLGHS